MGKMIEKKQLGELGRAVIGIAIWVAMAMFFAVFVYFYRGTEATLEYLGCYIIEWSLSIDNLFVFLSIFMAFGIKNKAQHRVLNWGIAGSIVLRLLFILFGIAIVKKWQWVLYIFGVILIINGFKMFKDSEEIDPHDSMLFKIISKILPLTLDYHGDFFIVKQTVKDKKESKVKRMFTPLFGIMVFITFADIIFAVDSVPAALSMSTDLFLVYTSNIFAVLGLRQLFFVIEVLNERFQYVKYGVGLILMFTGVKLGILIFHIEVDTLLSICIIAGTLMLSIVISSIISKKKDKVEKTLDANSRLSEKNP